LGRGSASERLERRLGARALLRERHLLPRARMGLGLVRARVGVRVRARARARAGARARDRG
jgi:hypothetical protein